MKSSNVAEMPVANIDDDEKSHQLENITNKQQVENELSTLSEKEKNSVLEGIEMVGFYVDEKKNNFFAEATTKALEKVNEKGAIGRFLSSLKETFVRDAEKAKLGLDNDANGLKSRSLKSGLSMAKLAGNILRYGRTAADVTGVTFASPFRYVMTGSMMFARGSEAAKEARLKNEKVIEKTRLDIDEASNEAWGVYEQAQTKAGENDVTKNELDIAYNENLPQDVLKRLQKNPEPGVNSNFLQGILKKHIEFSATRIENKLKKIQSSNLGDIEKEAKKNKIINKYSSQLKDFDRIVNQYGAVDALAMGAKYSEQGSKLAVKAMMIETAAELITKLPEFLSSSAEASNTPVSNPDRTAFDLLGKITVEDFNEAKKLISDTLSVDKDRISLKDNIIQVEGIDGAFEITEDKYLVHGNTLINKSGKVEEIFEKNIRINNPALYKNLADVNTDLESKILNKEELNKLLQNDLLKGRPEDINQEFDKKFSYVPEGAEPVLDVNQEIIDNTDTIEANKLFLEQLENSTIKKGQGIEHVLMEQLKANPEKYGFDPEKEISINKWAGGEAHRIAIKAGYVDMETGREIRVGTKGIDKVSYVLKEDADGKLKVEEWLKDKAGNYQNKETNEVFGKYSEAKFEGAEKDSYEYIHEKPEDGQYRVTDIKNVEGHDNLEVRHYELSGKAENPDAPQTKDAIFNKNGEILHIVNETEYIDNSTSERSDYSEITEKNISEKAGAIMDNEINKFGQLKDSLAEKHTNQIQGENLEKEVKIDRDKILEKAKSDIQNTLVEHNIDPTKKFNSADQLKYWEKHPDTKPEVLEKIFKINDASRNTLSYDAIKKYYDSGLINNFENTRSENLVKLIRLYESPQDKVTFVELIGGNRKYSELYKNIDWQISKKGELKIEFNIRDKNLGEDAELLITKNGNLFINGSDKSIKLNDTTLNETLNNIKNGKFNESVAESTNKPEFIKVDEVKDTEVVPDTETISEKDIEVKKVEKIEADEIEVVKKK